MDKLEPIIKHHFWILAFLVLPLGLWGYYSANSSLIAATEAREAQLDTAFGGIPSGNSPNGTWETHMKEIADNYEELVDISTWDLHELQESRMTWPPIMAPFKPDEYRGAWDGDRHFAYTQVYPQLLDDVWRRYEPVVPKLEEGEDRSWITWDEKVIIDPSAIQPVHQFGARRATDEQIWDAQEDIWLHRLIADAVVKTNEDADGAFTSIVRSVELIELMGGDGKPRFSPVPPAAAVAEVRGGMSLSGSSVEQYSGSGPSGRSGGATAVEVAFDPAEEIGSGGRMSARSARGSSGSLAEEMRMPGSGSGSGSGGSGAATQILRYVDFNENDRARVRAFYMSVIVHQSKFPEFLVELCNSDWPIQIVRFNIGTNPYYVDPSSPGRGGGPGSYGYGPTGGGPLGSGGPMGLGPMGRSGLGSPMTSSPMGGRPMGGRPGSGGVGAGRQTNEAYAALNNPELVQLDLLGLITIFNPANKPEAATTESTSDETATDDGEMTGDGTEIPVPEPSDDTAMDEELMPAEDADTLPVEPTEETTTDETESAVPMETENSAEPIDSTETSEADPASEGESASAADDGTTEQ